MSEKLKPCPFCGNDNIHFASKQFHEQSLYKKYCSVCGSSSGWWHESVKAREQWNTRAVIIPHMGTVNGQDKQD